MTPTHALSKKGEGPQARHPPTAKARGWGHFWGANLSKSPQLRLQTPRLCGTSLFTQPQVLLQVYIKWASPAQAGQGLTPNRSQGLGFFLTRTRSIPGQLQAGSMTGRQWSRCREPRLQPGDSISTESPSDTELQAGSTPRLRGSDFLLMKSLLNKK